MNMRLVGLRDLKLSRIGFLAVISAFLLTLPVLGADGDTQKPLGALQPPAGVKPANLASAETTASLPAKMTSAPIVSITDVTSMQEPGKLVIFVAASGPVSYQESLIPNPPRLVVDMENTELASPYFDLKVEAAGVRKVRVRQFQSSEPKIARMVVDLEENHGKPQVTVDGQSVRVSFPDPDPQPTVAPQEKAPVPAPPESKSTGDPAAGSTPTAAPPAKAAAKTAADTASTQKVQTPVIRDLSVSEIPRSSLASVVAEARPQPAVATPPPAPPAPAPPASPTPAKVVTVGPAHPANYAGQPLTLDLVDISLVDFFRLMAEEGGINIVLDPEIKGTISIKVVKVPWDQIFDAALANNGLDKQIEGNLVRIARKSTLQDEAKQREALKKANLLAADVETRVKRLNYAKAAEMLNTLVDQKTVRGTVVVDERTNSLLLTDLPSSLDKMTALIEKLDVPQPQVEIEARIVSATRDFARDIGVQFGFVAGNLERVTVGGPNTFGTIGGTRPSATPKNTYAGGNPYTGRGASQAQATESGGVSTGVGSNNAGNWNINLPSMIPFGGAGISVGNIFDTFLLDAAITAGETKGLAKLISQPKVTAQNNSPATITQGLRFPVQIIANNTVTVQFQNAALTLTVTPQITYEGNVVLDLKVENNTPDFARQVNGIPSIRTSESATRVLVSDGGTTVIGGILIDNETNETDQIPGLGSLPGIGYLFKRTFVSHSTQEVLFFITPRVVK
jgi:type IV pilus secretin PilQ/predicted competence protein